MTRDLPALGFARLLPRPRGLAAAGGPGRHDGQGSDTPQAQGYLGGTGEYRTRDVQNAKTLTTVFTQHFDPSPHTSPQRHHESN